MIPRIKDFKAPDGYRLEVVFDSGGVVVYDVGDDIANIKALVGQPLSLFYCHHPEYVFQTALKSKKLSR